jgi:hypothetical protein
MAVRGGVDADADAVGVQTALTTQTAQNREVAHHA